MRVTNLTNSPHDLINAKGEKVRLPARGSIEGFEPHPQHAGLYRTIGYFRFEEEAPKPEASETEGRQGEGDDMPQGGAVGDTPVIPAADAPDEATETAEPGDDQQPDEEGVDLRAEYRELAGKDADKRWGDARVLAEVEKLKG